MRKMVDTRAGLWLLITMGLLTVAAIVLFVFFAPARALTFPNLAGIAMTPQGVLLPVLGILLVTSEWGQRTGLVTFSLEPRRGRVVVAKTVAAVLIGLAALALLVGVGAVANVLGDAVQDGLGRWGPARGLVNMLILQLSAIIQGLAFGMLLRNSAAAIVTYFVLPTVFSVVFGVVGALNDLAPWVDLGTAQAPLFDSEAALTGEEWAQLLVTSMLWITLPFLVGCRVLLRSEVRST
jgi:hypothetical protein